MTQPIPPSDAADAFDLQRFLDAQDGIYPQALAELRAGRKRSHWMWFVFPQVAGLGYSAASRRYAITGLPEAEAYLRHPVLGPRLLACAAAVLGVEGRSATEVMGSPDDMKLRSCVTLFAEVSPPGSAFHQLLDKYFAGRADEATLRLIGRAAG